MLWTNTEYLAAASDDNEVSEVGRPTMTFVSTSCLKVDTNSSLISLTDYEFIQYVTIDIDAKDSTEAKNNEAAEMGKPKVTPKKTRKPYGFMQSCSVLLPSQIYVTKFTPHLGNFFQFNQRCGKN